MNEDKVFLDTNILVYAYDVSSGSKHDIARNIVTDLWNCRTGILSLQVLQELFINVTKKYPSLWILKQPEISFEIFYCGKWSITMVN
ncbi:MAG: hypothetical protein AB2L12_11145 [Smithellaceae bacterium]